MHPVSRITLTALPDIPLVDPGDDIAELILSAAHAADIEFVDGDVIVIAQKIISKAENRYVDLAMVEPSGRAKELSTATGKDARLVETILTESTRVVRHAKDLLIVEHRAGYILANAGIDQSNVPPAAGSEPVLLHPIDADQSAKNIRLRLEEALKRRLGVIINDSFGRPWRQGTIGTAIGASGICSLRNLRGQSDLFGRPLETTEVGHADEIAAAASLVMGQSAESHPVVVVSGFAPGRDDLPASTLLRPASKDLFR